MEILSLWVLGGIFLCVIYKTLKEIRYCLTIDEEPEDTLEPIVHSKGFNEALHILIDEEAVKIRDHSSYSRREKVFRTDEYLRSKLRDKHYNELTDYEKLYLLCFDREIA